MPIIDDFKSIASYMKGDEWYESSKPEPVIGIDTTIDVITIYDPTTNKINLHKLYEDAINKPDAKINTVSALAGLLNPATGTQLRIRVPKDFVVKDTVNLVRPDDWKWPSGFINVK